MLVRLTRGGGGHWGRGERDSRRGRESPSETALSHPDATGEPFFGRVVNFSIRGRCLPCDCEKENFGLREAIWDESEIWLIDGSSVLVDEALSKERRYFRFEAEFSSVHRSTSTSTSAPLEDGLPAPFRLTGAYMTGRRLRARLAQRQGRSAEQPTSEERKGVAHSC